MKPLLYHWCHRYMAIACYDKTVKIWDISLLHNLLTFLSFNCMCYESTDCSKKNLFIAYFLLCIAEMLFIIINFVNLVNHLRPPLIWQHLSLRNRFFAVIRSASVMCSSQSSGKPANEHNCHLPLCIGDYWNALLTV